MNDENNFGTGSPLEDIEYTAAPKKDGPEGVAAPVLDDIDYVPPSEKKGGPTGVSAPVLDDMDTYTPQNSEKKGAPTGVSAPVLDDDTAAFTQAAPKKLIMTDEEIIAGLTPEQAQVFATLPDEKKQQIIDMRRAQLGAEAPAPAVTAPVLDEDNYVPPPKKEEPPAEPAAPVTAPVLDDEPEAPKYVSKYQDEDLEKIKAEAKKKAVSSALTSNQKDSKESLRMMLELKEERMAELAKQGFKLTIVIALIGVLAAVAFYFLYSGSLGMDYKDDLGGISAFIQNSALYIAVAMGVCSLLIITGVGFFKSISTLVMLLTAVAQIFPGLPMLPQHQGGIAKAGVFYAVALVGTIAVIVMLSASEAVGQFFKKKKPGNYD